MLSGTIYLFLRECPRSHAIHLKCASEISSCRSLEVSRRRSTVCYIRDSAIPRTSSDQIHVLQDMFKVDYEREREGNEDFVTKCNKAFLLSTCMPNVRALWMYGECVQCVVFVHGMMSKQQHQGYTMHGHFCGSYVVKLSISAAAGK